MKITSEMELPQMASLQERNDVQIITSQILKEAGKMGCKWIQEREIETRELLLTKSYTDKIKTRRSQEEYTS